MVIFVIFAPPHYLSRVKGYSQLLLCEAPKRTIGTIDQPFRAFLFNLVAVGFGKTDDALAVRDFDGSLQLTLDADADAVAGKAQNQAPFIGMRLERMEKEFLLILKLSQLFRTGNTDCYTGFELFGIPADFLVRFD